MAPLPPFDQDRWELYHVAEDASESRDLAEAHPEKVRELQDLWWREAGRYGALPLHSRRVFAPGRPPAVRRRERVALHPGAAAVPEEIAPDTKLRPHSIAASFEVPAAGAEGVLVAQGGRFGGYSLFLQDGLVQYACNFAGVEVVTIASDVPLDAGSHLAGVELAPLGGLAMRVELVVDGAVVASGDIARTAPYRFALAGEGLCCGYDDGTPVTDRYSSPFEFTGTLHEVVIDVGGTPVEDLAADVERAWKTQ
jgi:arylsulfatase